MAFRNIKKKKENFALTGLIDVIFLLLIFFLVTKVVSGLGRVEQRVSLSSPKNEEGCAETLIQIVNEDEFLWLDAKVYKDIYRELKSDRQGFGYYSVERKSELIRTSILDLPKCSYKGLINRLHSKFNKISMENKRGSKIKHYYFLVRCPDNYSYGEIIRILRAIEKDKGGDGYVQYGVVGGDMSGLESAEYKIIEGGVKIVFKKDGNV